MLWMFCSIIVENRLFVFCDAMMKKTSRICLSTIALIETLFKSSTNVNLWSINNYHRCQIYVTYARKTHFSKSFSLNNIWSIKSIFRSTKCTFRFLNFCWNSTNNWLFNSIALNSNNLKSTFNECAFNKSSTSKRANKKDFKSK